MTPNEKTRQLILSLVEKIKERYSPVKIVLFGSHAYGKPDVDSDIDLLIIKNTDKRPMDRWVEIKRILRDFQRTAPVSPLIYTEKEIEERKAIKDFFIEEILEKGEVLYG
jgi:predicted nucleotidyltransferase